MSNFGGVIPGEEGWRELGLGATESVRVGVERETETSSVTDDGARRAPSVDAGVRSSLRPKRLGGGGGGGCTDGGNFTE